MPRNRGLPTRPKPKDRPLRSVRRRKRTPKSRKTTTPSGLGNLACKGVKSVLGALPGSSLTVPFADFVFKTFGWSTDTLKASEIAAKTQLNVYIAGLFSIFTVQPRTFGSGIPGFRQPDFGTHGVGTGSFITTNYTEFRVSHFTARLKTTGPSTSSGMVYIGFSPITMNIAPSAINMVKVTPAYVQAMPYNASCRMGSSCTLRFYATPASGLFYQYSAIDSDIGYFCICYEDLCRPDWHEFSASDFQCQLDLNGTVVARSFDPFEQTSVYTHVSDYASERVAGVVMASVDGTQKWLPVAPKSFQCTKNSDHCTWSFTAGALNSVSTPSDVTSADFELINAPSPVSRLTSGIHQL